MTLKICKKIINFLQAVNVLKLEDLAKNVEYTFINKFYSREKKLE